jgi:hypothetical protein
MNQLKLHSEYKNLGGGIVMPEFKERKLYMHKTRMDDLILPADFADYIGTVDQVLNKVANRNDVCYITIDEKNISANNSHRRGGAHVDFNWFESMSCHGSSTPTPSNGGHGSPMIVPTPSTGSHGNPIPTGGHGNPLPTGGHGNTDEMLEEYRRLLKIEKRKRKIGGILSDDDEMMMAAKQWYKTVENGGMLLVADNVGCQVWKGDIKGEIGEGGCCANVDLTGLQSEIMRPNEVFYLNALGIHESIKLNHDAQRSLIRIAFHPNYKFEA